jgi:hypothetical protein
MLLQGRALYQGRVELAACPLCRLPAALTKAKCSGQNEKASLKAHSPLYWEAPFANVPEWRNWQTR